MWAAMQRTIDCFLMQFFTDIEQESPGVICPRVLAIGKSCTSALVDGQGAAFSIDFSRRWRAIPITEGARQSWRDQPVQVRPR
jgi:hypothetical protein